MWKCSSDEGKERGEDKRARERERERRGEQRRQLWENDKTKHRRWESRGKATRFPRANIEIRSDRIPRSCCSHQSTRDREETTNRRPAIQTQSGLTSSSDNHKHLLLLRIVSSITRAINIGKSCHQEYVNELVGKSMADHRAAFAFALALVSFDQKHFSKNKEKARRLSHLPS